MTSRAHLAAMARGVWVHVTVKTEERVTEPVVNVPVHQGTWTVHAAHRVRKECMVATARPNAFARMVPPVTLPLELAPADQDGTVRNTIQNQSLLVIAILGIIQCLPLKSRKITNFCCALDKTLRWQQAYKQSFHAQSCEIHDRSYYNSFLDFCGEHCTARLWVVQLVITLKMQNKGVNID